jgi:hypothetical protein
MAGRSPRWGAVAFALVVALAGGIVVLARHFLSAPASLVDASSAAHEPANANGAARSAARGDAPSRSDATDAATPSVTAVEPRLEWPDEESLRKLEEGGRALFGGIVRAPDGSPCPGATVWFDGAIAATTDEHGAWRSDVSLAYVDEETGIEYGRGFVYYLFARKEGVGFASALVELPSRRVDLDLVAGFSFSGTVVDFDDGTPIGGAELELREAPGSGRVAVFSTRTDALGRFAFPNLQDGNVYVRGRAPGYDSNGSFGYDFSKGRDMVVAYRLRRQFKLRGRFVPWPVAGVASDQATVRAHTRSPHDRGNTKLECSGPIGPDGRFELPAPVCPSCELELVAGDVPFWSDELDTNEERGDFDVGDIPLLPAANLTGRFDVPDAELRGRIEVVASVARPTGSGGVESRAHLAPDGSFRVAPLPPGVTQVRLVLGRFDLATLHDASGLDGDERENGFVVLVAGATRDVGVLAMQQTLLFGSVRDAEGRPAAYADLGETVNSSSVRYVELFSVRADAEGRYAGLRRLDALDGDERSAHAGRAVLEIGSFGHLSQRIEFDVPASQRWVRHDVVFAAGSLFRGTVVDDDERPRPFCTILISSEDETASSFGEVDSRSDGSFEFRGVTAGSYRIIVVDGAGSLRFDGIHPEKGAVTLRPRAASKQ